DGELLRGEDVDAARDLVPVLSVEVVAHGAAHGGERPEVDVEAVADALARDAARVVDAELIGAEERAAGGDEALAGVERLAVREPAVDPRRARGLERDRVHRCEALLLERWITIRWKIRAVAALDSAELPSPARERHAGAHLRAAVDLDGEVRGR